MKLQDAEEKKVTNTHSCRLLSFVQKYMEMWNINPLTLTQCALVQVHIKCCLNEVSDESHYNSDCRCSHLLKHSTFSNRHIYKYIHVS